MGITIRGADQQDEISRARLLRDPRSIFAQAWDALATREYFGFGMVILCVTPFIWPASTLLCLLAAFPLYAHRKSGITLETLPFRMPFNAHCVDRHDMNPGRQSGYHMARGKFFVGQEHGTKKQLWLKFEDILTHMLILGTTGSGKTEFLVSLAFNALALGSGFFYVDPKGAPKLAFQVYVMCRMLGRDDDFRVMSYNTGGKSVATNSPKRMSNSQNPFSFAPADAIEQLIVSLIPKTEGGNSIFSNNAQVVISGIIYGLVELRDRGFLRLSTQTINEHLNLSQADALARDPRLSEMSANHVKTALRTVGWREETPLDEQVKTNKSLMEQFGYARAYFGQFLNQLGYTYGYIFNHEIGEIDMRDIILQRRVLVVILPSLEKSPQELEALGKITLSSVRNAVAVGLGDKLQGDAEDVLFSLPTDAPSPFLSITDEYAAIPTPGYAEVLTQGRGLGVSAIVASQDWGGIEGADAKGAKQIASNVKIKYAMKLEDGKDTWEFFKAQAGQVLTMRTNGYEREADNVTGVYYDGKGSQASPEELIHIRDLQEQTEGEFHAFFNGMLVRGFGFFLNPPIAKHTALRIAQLLPITPPDDDIIQARRQKAKELAGILVQMLDGKHSFVKPTISDETSRLFMSLRDGFALHAALQPMERAIVAFWGTLQTTVSVGRDGGREETQELGAESKAVCTTGEIQADQNFFDMDFLMETGNAKSEPAKNRPLDLSPEKTESLPSEPGRGDGDEELADFDDIQAAMNMTLGMVEDTLEPEEHSTIADIASAEEMLGAAPDEARALAEEAVNIARHMAEYPQAPKPKGVTADQLDEAFRQMLGG